MQRLSIHPELAAAIRNTSSFTKATLEADLLANPAVSYWLKQAIHDLNGRDPLDAARDAELLAILMRKRASEMEGS